MKCIIILAQWLIVINFVIAYPGAKEAYVSLLYGDEFLLGVRVLGKSIRDTGSKKDMVVLVSDGVSDHAKTLLEADGWIVEAICLLENPNQVRPKRFWGVYTKLKVFNMTNYSKVIYLDADTVVLKNIEVLFKCGKFCANLKHSERLNSGVMVVEPSEAVYCDMIRKVHKLPSYTGGDQGFLNSYYSEFPNSNIFNTNLPKERLDSRPLPAMERLSTLYNADVGLFMLANKWMVDESELCIIHYTLGPFKPWDWWTSWLLKPVDVWQGVRITLEESLPGTGGGKNPKDELVVKFLLLIPLCGALFCCHQFLSQLRVLCRSSFCGLIRHMSYHRFRSNGSVPYTGISPPIINSVQVPGYLGGISIFACFFAAIVSIVVSLMIVPRQVMPWTGVILLYEWTFTTFFLLFGGFLRIIYLWGKARAIHIATSANHLEYSDYDTRKGYQRQDTYLGNPFYYWLGMAFLALSVPSFPCALGITSLFLRLGLMIVGGLVLASFMTYASEHLAIRSFVKGFEGNSNKARGFP